jgi:multiple antibiotic resistance protein
VSWFDTTAFTTTFVTLVVIFGPPGSIPIFLALTAGLDARERNAAARRAALVALGVIASFAVFGERLLDYLGITLPALQASGGLLLLIVAMQLLGLAGSPTEQRADAGVNVALVPLGTPILAGPGAIVATMLAVQRAQGDPAGLVAVAAALVAALLVVYLSFRFAAPIARVLKDSGIVVLTRIAGVLLSAIAVQMIANAVIAFVAGEGNPAG